LEQKPATKDRFPKEKEKEARFLPSRKHHMGEQ
jgi:hypothetical protein